MSKQAFALIILLLLFFSGCTVDAVVNANISEKGSGKAIIKISSLEEIDKEINDFFKQKKNAVIEKQKISDSDYEYTVTISFNDVSELSKNAKFSATDKGNQFEYDYSDILTSKSLTGSEQELPGLTYCVSLPGVVSEMHVENLKETTYDNTNKACVDLDSDTESKRFSVKFIDKKKGCQYNNPRCNSDYDCIENKCVLKQGCEYNNPSCDENHDCIKNSCVLKKGCQYQNPSCDENHNCIENECVLKEGCQYNNPSCEEYYDCIENECVVKSFPWLFVGSVFLFIIIILVVGIIIFKKKESNDIEVKK